MSYVVSCKLCEIPMWSSRCDFIKRPNVLLSSFFRLSVNVFINESVVDNLSWIIVSILCSLMCAQFCFPVQFAFFCRVGNYFFLGHYFQRRSYSRHIVSCIRSYNGDMFISRILKFFFHCWPIFFSTFYSWFSFRKWSRKYNISSLIIFYLILENTFYCLWLYSSWSREVCFVNLDFLLLVAFSFLV